MKVANKDKLESLKLSLKWMYRSSPKLMVFVVILVIFGGLLTVLEPYLFKTIIDELTQRSSSDTISSLGIGLVGVVAAIAILKGVEFIFWQFTDTIRRYHNLKIDQYAAYELMNKVASLDAVYFEDPEYYNLLYQSSSSFWRILDMFWSFTFAIRNVVSIVAVIGVLLFFDWRLVALIVVGSVPGIYAASKMAERSWGAFISGSPISRHANYYKSLLSESPHTIKELKTFGLKQHFLSKFTSLFSTFLDIEKKVVKKHIVIQTFAGLFLGLVGGIAAWIIIQSFLQNRITIGEVTFLWIILFQMTETVGWLVRNYSVITQHATFMVPFTKIMNLKQIIKDPENPVPFPKKIKKGIEFRNVTFYYRGSKRPALKNFDLFIRPNESVAIVGENGSGKTTLIKLLCRLYDVSEGEILIDGINIKNFALDDLYENIGVIFQDFVKYEALVEENIGFGRIKQMRNKRKVHNAAMKSGAWEFVKGLDGKYKTVLGRRLSDEGTDLSVGQWQKIALARAFFRDSQIMILDEPTAAVDAKAEYELFRKFEKLTKNKTTLLISHRFSTVRMADHIIVMDKARIIETGTHEDLIKKNGMYAHLFNLQAKGYK